MFTSEYLVQQMQKMHQNAPLVHCMTNDVVVNFTANVLLAIGASPAMVVAKEESADFAQLACALIVNPGTLTSQLAESIKSAVRSASAHHVPWVLDPVAVGALKFRTDFCFDLMQYRPQVIRGNAAEITVLDGMKAQSKGPDSLMTSDDALTSAQNVARHYQTVVALTGQTDYITDGHTTYALNNGHEQLTRVTGAGCSLSAMVAAYCAVCETPLLAALCAVSHMAIAGEVAANLTTGVGSFAVALLDQLQLLAQDSTSRLVCQKL